MHKYNFKLDTRKDISTTVDAKQPNCLRRASVLRNLLELERKNTFKTYIIQQQIVAVITNVRWNLHRKRKISVCIMNTYEYMNKKTLTQTITHVP